MTRPFGATLSRASARRHVPQTFTYDFTGGVLPAGLSLSRASNGWYVDGGKTIQLAAANVARFGYDQDTLLGPYLLVEPSSINWVKNGSWAGAVAGTAPAMTTAQTPGVGGTLPSNTQMIIPGSPSGTDFGWQIVGTGTTNGVPYIDVRFVGTNNVGVVSPTNINGSVYFRFQWSASAGIPAAVNDTWSVSANLQVVGGAITPLGNVALHMRSRYTGNDVTFFSGNSVLNTDGTSRFNHETFTFATGPVDSMSAGVSVSVALGETIDVTLRVYQPQIEKQPFALSPIPTTNGTLGTPVRQADTLNVPVANGTWYVRWLSHWKNYDQQATAAGGALALTVPAPALADGNVEFTGLVVSNQPLPPDAKRLRWSPPPLGPYVQYVTVANGQSYLPGSTEVSPKDGHVYGAVSYYETDVDVVVSIPAGGLDGHFKVVGGHNVYVIGGRIEPTDPTLTAWLMSFAGQSGSVYVEGVHLIGSSTTAQLDGIDITGTNPAIDITERPIYTPDIYIQKCRIEGIHGHKDNSSPAGIAAGNLHADGFQVQGPIGRLFVDLVTMFGSYQGFFWAPQWFNQSDLPAPSPIIAGRTASRCNLRYWSYDAKDDHAAMLWLRDSDWLVSPPEEFVPTELNQIWCQPNPAVGGPTTKVVGTGVPATGFFGGGVWPGPLDQDPTTAALVGVGNLTLAWPNKMQVNGCAWNGTPPGGDFVTANDCGDFYKSPGYVYAP